MRLQSLASKGVLHWKLLRLGVEQNRQSRWVSPLAEVQVHEGESLENALKRFKRKVLQEDIKRHAFYLKPGQKKRTKAALARKRLRKKRSRDGEPERTS
jgi:small subunit ribosomal protein S21